MFSARVFISGLCATPLASALTIDPVSSSSLASSASSLIFNLLSPYNTNASGVQPYLVGTLPLPLYWWHAGAVWGAALDYWAFTNDTSYNPSVTQALLTQAGPQGDLMPQQFRGSMGNDDISFWTYTVLSALEYDLPFPSSSGSTNNVTSWLQLADTVFNGMVGRWNSATCNGGLKWQVYSENAGYDYKNAVSNGGFFQISARLARYTGNATYLDWANKIWDWSAGIGLIDRSNYAVYDGSDDTINCTELDHTQWSYNPAIFLGGVAYLYNFTNGSSLWGDRAINILAQANRTFFSPFSNSTNVLYEQACELKPRQTGAEQDAEGGCDQDQLLFKAFFARWASKAAVLAPLLAPYVAPLLSASARGAAVACSGSVPGTLTSSGGLARITNLGINTTICAQHFYSSASYVSQLSSEGYFSNLDIGQKIGHHLSALEVVQGNIPLVDLRTEQDGGPRNIRYASQVKIQAAPSTTVVLPTAAPTTPSSGKPAKGAVASNSVSGVMLAFCGILALA